MLPQFRDGRRCLLWERKGGEEEKGRGGGREGRGEGREERGERRGEE